MKVRHGVTRTVNRRFLLKHIHEIDDIANRSVEELRLVGHQTLVTVPPRMLTLLAFQARATRFRAFWIPNDDVRHGLA